LGGNLAITLLLFAYTNAETKALSLAAEVRGRKKEGGGEENKRGGGREGGQRIGRGDGRKEGSLSSAEKMGFTCPFLSNRSGLAWSFDIMIQGGERDFRVLIRGLYKSPKVDVFKNKILLLTKKLLRSIVQMKK
jgi:hypothetical protein